MAERREREFRPLRRINRRVVGVLGWPYPVLNAILEFFERLRARRLERLSRAGMSSSLRTTVKNIERLSWVDYKGRKRTLVIEREVKET